MPTAKRYAKYKAAGMCPCCGLRVGVDGKACCAECLNYHAKRQQRYWAFTKRWKQTAGCYDCGVSNGAEATKRLHFDHVKFPKLFEPSNGWKRAHKKALAELLKCVVRCVDCHAVKTARERYGEGF